MNIKQYFTSQYLFQINTVFVSPAEKLFLLAGIIFVLLAVVMKIAGVLAPTPVDRKYREKFYLLFLTVGLWEIIWFALRYENIKFFGSHFVAWLGILIGLIWFISILVSAFKNYKKDKVAFNKDQLKMKYLPK